MLQAKLLRRRLACVRWLLVAGLVLGWSGKAASKTATVAEARILLSVNPSVISEDAGSTAVVVTGTLGGRVFGDDVIVGLTTGDTWTAMRGRDYTAVMRHLTIRAGSVSGTTTVTITPRNDERAGGDKTIRLRGVSARGTVVPVYITLQDAGEGNPSFFAADAAIANQMHIVGAAMADLVLPAASGGTGELTYGVSSLPSGLSFDAATRTLSGTPTAATHGAVTIVYTATDESGTTDMLTFSITVHPGVIDISDNFDSLLDLFSGEIGGAVPEELKNPSPAFAADAAIENQAYTAKTAIDPLVLPAASGGTGELTYGVSSLPVGLSFDAATRTLSGTPTAATHGAVTVIYAVIDSAGNAAALPFSITVEKAKLPPPVFGAQLSVTPSLIREDAGMTQVSLTVNLAAARATDEVVTFTIVPPRAGTPAVRDVDYVASLGAIISIPAGATVGTTILTLTPINNAEVDSLRALGVQARFVSGVPLRTDIPIVDDETPSTSIALSVSPHAISEDSGETVITVTATLDGKALALDATVIVAIDAASAATRDMDYAALFNPVIVIPAGSIMGSTQFAIRPVNDAVAEGNETIKLLGAIAGLAGDEVEITLSDPVAEPDEPDKPDEPDDSSLAFADNTVIENQAYTAGTAITPLVLPAASDGTAPLTYSLSALPVGLVFDAATRTLSGTPAAATDGAVTIIYTVIDSAGDADALVFSIAVNPELSFESFFDLFGAGKLVPTGSHE